MNDFLFIITTILVFVIIFNKPIIIKIPTIISYIYPLVFTISYKLNVIPRGVKYIFLNSHHINIILGSYIIFYLFLMLIPIKKKHIVISQYEIKVYWALIAMFLLTFILYEYPRIINLPHILSLSSEYRREYLNQINVFKIFNYTYQMIYIYICYSKQNKKKVKILSMLTIFMIFSFIIDVICGNRRELLLIILCLFPFIIRCLKESGFMKKLIIFSSIGIIGLYLLFVPIIRMGGEFSINRIVEVAFGYSDFNAPVQVLAVEMDRGEQPIYLESYFKVFKALGRDVFKLPLSVEYRMREFMYRNSSNLNGELVGWAYTPFAEAYISFGYIGFVIFSLVFTIVIFIINYRKKRYTDFYIGLYIMFMYQFFRSDFANFIVIMSLYYINIIFIRIIQGLVIKRRING